MMLDLLDVERYLKTQWAGRGIIYRPSVGSTQDVAGEEAARGAPEGTTIFAEEQTAGRGRLGRSWVSPAGRNLYFTLLMRPPLERLRSLSIVAPLAVALAVEKVTGLRPQLKWPNDVLINERKLSGILIETELSGDSVNYALVGIGVNVNFDIEEVPEIANIATSLKRELGRETSREELLATLLNWFEELFEIGASDRNLLLAQWRARLGMLGRRVKVTFHDQAHEGLAEDVDAEGNLILIQADGRRIVIEGGEVTLRE